MVLFSPDYTKDCASFTSFLFGEGSTSLCAGSAADQLYQTISVGRQLSRVTLLHPTAWHSLSGMIPLGSLPPLVLVYGLGCSALSAAMICDSADAFRKTKDGECPSIMKALVGHSKWTVPYDVVAERHGILHSL